MAKKIAVILAGAVAKGAFEAGALSELVKRDVQIRRIVVASSGGLNGTVLAAGARAGDVKAAAARLLDLWQNHASFVEAFHPSLKGWLRLEGISDQKALLDLLHRQVPPVAAATPQPVDLRFVVAPLNGVNVPLNGRTATSYEAVLTFADKEFDGQPTLDKVFEAAVASAAFPGVFEPVEIDKLGPCVDGGVVNNTPVRYALEGDVGKEIEAIVVIVPSTEFTAPAREWHGPALIGHLADMLINERLYRDLKEAFETNTVLENLEKKVPDPARRQEILDAVGWGDRRRVPILAIRPAQTLDGGPFSALFHRKLRTDYIDAGIAAATAALAGQRDI